MSTIHQQQHHNNSRKIMRLDTLPMDLTIYCFQYLTNSFIVNTVSLVNRRLNQLCCQKCELWEERCIRVVQHSVDENSQVKLANMLVFFSRCSVANLHLSCHEEWLTAILAQQCGNLRRLVVETKDSGNKTISGLVFPVLRKLDISKSSVSFQRYMYAAVFGSDETKLEELTHVNQGENLLVEYIFDMKELKRFNVSDVDTFTLQSIVKQSRLEELTINNRSIDPQFLISLFKIDSVKNSLKKLDIRVSDENNRKYEPKDNDLNQLPQLSLEQLSLPYCFSKLFEPVLRVCTRTLKKLSLSTTPNISMEMGIDFSLSEVTSIELQYFSASNIHRILLACGSNLQEIVIRDVPESRYERQSVQLSFGNLQVLDLKSFYISPVFCDIVKASTRKTIEKCSIRGRTNHCTVEQKEDIMRTVSHWQSVHDLTIPGDFFSSLSEDCLQTIHHLTLDWTNLDAVVQDRILKCKDLQSFSLKSDSSVSTKMLLHVLLEGLPHLKRVNMHQADFKKKQYVPPDGSMHFALQQLKINLNIFTPDCLKRIFQRIPNLQLLHSLEFPIIFDKFCDLTHMLNTVPLKYLALSVQALTAAGISRYKVALLKQKPSIISLKYGIHLSFEEMLLATLCLLHTNGSVDYSIKFEGSLESNPSLRQYQVYDMQESLQREVKYKGPSIVDQIVGLEQSEKEYLKRRFEEGQLVPSVQYLIDRLYTLRRESEELENSMRFRESIIHQSALWF